MPAAFFRVNVVPLTPVTALLKVAVMSPADETAVPPDPGVRAVTVGAAAVVKVQLVLASAMFAVSLMAVVPPVRRTV